MTTKHVLTGQRVHNPSGQQIRKIIGKSHVAANWQMKPGYLYTVVRAISARVNQNFDGWPSSELKAAAHTFVGKPVFVNHENFNPDYARGVVVAARYVENGRDKYIETVMEIDANRFPILAKEIKTGGLDSVSMGAEAGFTVCSACGNKAYDEPDMCDHVKFHKGKTIRVHNRRTGKTEDKLVYESCHKLSFFELSYVFDPADETAVASKVVVGSKTASDCPPGQPCNGWGKPEDSSSSSSPAGQAAQSTTTSAPSTGTDSAAASSLGKTPAVSGDLGKPDADGVLPSARPLYDTVKKYNPDIGTYRVDDYHEHDHGALDVMTKDQAVADRVKADAFAAGSPYVLWNQTQWNSDGTSSKMDDRGSPTQNHMDHVHTAPIGGKSAIRHAVLAKLASAPTPSLKERVAMAVFKKVAFGEVEAPPEVDTLRVEGTAPEDDNDDFHHYVDSPQELSMPDLSEAAQLDREQEEQPSVGGMDTGTPGPSSPEGDVDGQMPAGDPGVQGDEGQYMTLKIPVPQQAPAAPAGPPPAMGPSMAPPPAPGAPPQMPMQTFGSRADTQMLSWFDRYYGYRVADWRDAIEAGRDLTFEERADFVREATLSTLENTSADSPTSRNSVKGTANMARSTLATRSKTAGTRHFVAEGPLTDGGDVSRNDQGEQEEAFITETPSPDSDQLPDEDTTNISNTEGNLVADEAYAHGLTARMRQQQAALVATAEEYKLAVKQGLIRKANGDAGGPTATEVNPEVPTPSAEQLTGDNFDSADPNPSIDTSVAGPGTTTLPIESSLQAFRAFDKWLHAHTKKSVRQHTEVNIRKAAKQFADYNGVSTQVLFPALGIALRQARKTEAANKAQSKKVSNVRKQAVDLETAAPDERVSVPTPVADVTDADAQASQFDESGWDNNAGKDITEPDLSTGQNFAPGQAPKTSRKADGILAIRCAEAMIAAGLEPNTRERKYQLAGEYQNMSRGLIMDRTALAERFAMVRHADRQKVASGSTRGAVQSPIPAGLGQGGSVRQANVQRTAANQNHPDNDSLMFG